MVSVENNSIFKKISAVIVMITALVFFSFNVFATTYNPSTYNSYTDAVTYNGVTYNVRVTQLKALSEGTSLLPGGMETIMLVSLQMTNNTSDVKSATIPKLTIDLSDERIITDVYTYGGDFTLGLLSGGIGIFYPSSEFSLDNNKVVVPPNKSLYCVGAIGLPAQLSQDGSSTLDTGLRGVHLYDKSNYSVTNGNYSYGNPVDLSNVISVLNDIDTNTDGVEGILNNILASIQYTGNNYSPSISNAELYDSTLLTNENVSDLQTRVFRILSPEYYLTNDIEINSTSDTIIHSGTKARIMSVRLVMVNGNTSQSVRFGEQISISNLMPSGVVAYEIVSVDSQDFNSVGFQAINTNATGRRLYFRFINAIDGYGYIGPKHRTELTVQLKLYYDDNASLTYYDPVLNLPTTPRLVSGIYAPRSIYELLRDWFTSYQSVNGVDDFSDNSNDVADVSDSNHIIEENYYSANASAIEATGLSNFHFSNEQNNGISSVSNDFMLLWNALGSWNGVYIFSLTMALATFIMRHGGLFTVKRKESDKGGEE